MKKQIQLAIEALLRGDPIGLPTETVYGLAAPIFDEKAIKRVFELKGRPQDNPLIAHISHLDQVHQIAIDIPEAFYELAKVFFPGPLTIVLKKHPDVPAIVSGGLDTIAIRMPSHPLAKEIIQGVGQPLVAPSANISGKPSSTCVEHVKEDFLEQLACIVDGGPSVYGLESTVLSLVHPKPTILRPGEISKEQIEKVLQGKICVGSGQEKISPGTRYRHYAPKAKIVLFEDIEKLQKELEEKRPEKCWILAREKHNFSVPTFALYRSNLYSLFRDADRLKCKEIWIYIDSVLKEDTTLMNRIFKASQP